MTGSVEDIKRILRQGVQGYLSPTQANNLVLQLTIFAADPIDENSLRMLARYFTPQDYEDLIEERTIVSRCGYPTCQNMLLDASGHIRNPLARSIVSWQHSFCQIQCYQASDFYRAQLSTENLATRENVAWYSPGDMRYEQDIILLPEATAMAKLQNKSVAQTVADMVRSQKQLSDSMLSLSVSSNSNEQAQTAPDVYSTGPCEKGADADAGAGAGASASAFSVGSGSNEVTTGNTTADAIAALTIKEHNPAKPPMY